MSAELVDSLKKFLPIAIEHLGLSEFPKLKPVLQMPTNGEQGSFGGYNAEDDCIYFAIQDRHPNDILRTLAHELVHAHQRATSGLDIDDGATGSDKENEANSVAGIIMREFGQRHPESFDNAAVDLEEATDYTSGNIDYHSELNPAVWTDTEMQPEVRLRLLQIAKTFVDYLDVPGFKPLDIVLTGSATNFNYTKHSDLDLHIVTNYEDLQCDDLAEAFYRAKKDIWNNQHDITIHGHEVELYVEDVKEPPVSAGVYSVLRGRWLKEPVNSEPSIDRSAINAKVTDLIKQINSIDDAQDIVRLRDKLRKMRRSGLDTHGEFGVDNLSFKVLRNLGYLDRMNSAVLDQQDQELSLK